MLDRSTATQPDLSRPVFIGNEIYRRANFGPKHPLSVPRVPATIDLVRALGWLPDDAYVESSPASPQDLLRFHDADYVAVLRRGERDQELPETLRQAHNLGKLENPIHDTMYSRPATSAGAMLAAADLLNAADTVDQRAIVYSPAGGTHHGRPGRASGFCYFNDPVFAILSFLDEGAKRVLYVDVDAHHGDGVQDAFADDNRVFTISIHEAGRFPFSGPAEDRGGGQARNFPVPRGFNDSELEYLIEAAVLPLGHDFEPDAVVVTCGADGLAGDPLSAMALSNVALWRAVEMVLALAPAAVVLGGGGYNPWTVARCWTGLWGRLNGWPTGEGLPAEARKLLQGLDSDLVDEEDRQEDWFTVLADRPAPGPVRDEIKAVARAALNGV